MNFQQRRHYYNRCKPFEVLEPDDERNVDLDRLGTESQRVRGVNWVQHLAARIELSDEPVCELFTGLPGSGKSTELVRLAERLSLADKANFFVVTIQAEELLDLANPIDIPDVIFAILYATDTALLAAEAKDPAAALGEGYFRRLWSWLTQTDIELTKAEFAVPEVGKMVVELKTRPSLRARVRNAVAAYLTRFLDEARGELAAMQERAKKLGRSGIVVLFDSLEKLRGITANWEDVLRSAERIFADGAPHLKLPVHVLYTIPAALVSRKRFEHVSFMPMIKLRTYAGERFAPGYDAAYELVVKRVPEEILVEVFGAQNVTPRLESLIEVSGGYPREIVRLLQSVLSLEQLPVSDSDFARIRNEVGDSYRKIVPADAFPWLARVAVDRYLTLESDAHRQAADLMLSNNAVLRYLNDQDWFDLHPTVRQIPGVAAEIAKLQAATTKA